MADNLYWIAGLLEGEGCFQFRNRHNPIIQLCMTDKDVVIRAAKVLGCHKVIEQNNKTVSGKSVYRTVLYGNKAVQWIMTIYSLMGGRRKIQLRKCIDSWRSNRNRTYKERKSYSRGSKMVWERQYAI